MQRRLSTLFSEVPSDRIDAVAATCSCGKLQLDQLDLMGFCAWLGFGFLSPTKRVFKYWKRLSREVVISPSLEIFKALLEMARATCSNCTCFECVCMAGGICTK